MQKIESKHFNTSEGAMDFGLFMEFPVAEGASDQEGFPRAFVWSRREVRVQPEMARKWRS